MQNSHQFLLVCEIQQKKDIQKIEAVVIEEPFEISD